MFARIQSLQYMKTPHHAKELAYAVEKANNDYNDDSIEDKFSTQQNCPESSMKVCGENDYEIRLENEKGATSSEPASK